LLNSSELESLFDEFEEDESALSELEDDELDFLFGDSFFIVSFFAISILKF
jgi:hypothetical protein